MGQAEQLNRVAELREVLESLNAAIRARDIDAAAAHYAEDVLLFDVVDPLRFRGVGDLRERLQQWFAQFDGDIGYDLHDLQLEVGEDLAFTSSLNQVRGTLSGGEPLEMFWRATLCFVCRDGRWLVIHGHSSVPFDMATGQASLGLRP